MSVLTLSDLGEGLQRAEWPGRMQRMTDGLVAETAPRGSEIWLDGGHNPAAGHAVAEMIAELEEKRPRPLFLISGMINTKDPVGYFEAFSGMAKHVYTVPVTGSEAGIDPVVLAEDAADAGLSAQPAASLRQALSLLREDFDALEAPPRILIGGSLYLVGDVLKENGIQPR